MSHRKEQQEFRRRALLQAFPRLLRADLPYLEYGYGWDWIIHGLLRKIDGLLDDEQVTAFRIVQIKEKFGTLHLYYRLHDQGMLHVDVQDGQGLPVRLVVGEVAEPSCREDRPADRACGGTDGRDLRGLRPAGTLAPPCRLVHDPVQRLLGRADQEAAARGWVKR